jgi:hypothetical protein
MGDTATVKPLHEAIPANDISSELWRDYIYPDGKTFRVNDPLELYIVNGSHRVVDMDGVTYRPERGYVGIRWKPRAGKPPFDF